MSTKITLEYLSKLLNKPITERMEIVLSSAQKSRVNGWLTQNGISFNESVLIGKFTIEQLLKFIDADANSAQNYAQKNISSITAFQADNFQIGVDIQRVDELFPGELPYDPKAEMDLIKIFTAKELSYAQSRSDPEVTLSGIFSAKEAIIKTLNEPINLNEIEILPDRAGKPQCNGYVLSISHSGDYAVAIAIPQKVLNNFSIAAKLPENFGVDPSKFRNHQLKLRLVDLIFIAFFLIISFVIFMRW